MTEQDPMALYRGEKRTLRFVQDRLESGQDKLGNGGAPVMVVDRTGDDWEPIDGSLVSQVIQDLERQHGVSIRNQLLLPVRLPGEVRMSLAVYELYELA